MQISVFCGNCDHGPVMLCCLEDGEKTRCASCGVYMHDAILEEDFDQDYCQGCESGADCSSAHTERCQQKEMMKRKESFSEDDEEEDYCHGCESGADCASAHTERCQMLLMNV